MAFIFLKYLTNTGEAKTSEVVTMHDGIVDLCLKESWPKIIWKFGFPRETNERSWEHRDDTEMYRLISSIGFAFASSITCFNSLSLSKMMFSKCSVHHSKFGVVKNQYLKCVILKDTKNWLISKILHLSLFV